MTTDDRIREATSLLEAYARENALPPETEATVQEAIELLSGLEASTDPERPADPERPGSLAATFGSDTDLSGAFGPDDVVLFDPRAGDAEWIAAAYAAVVSLDEHR
jgi:hypothetical protein